MASARRLLLSFHPRFPPWRETGQLDPKYASRLRIEAALRLSGIAITATFSPTATIDHSKASSSRAH